MALRKCDVSECHNPAARSLGSCMICARHWCSKHVNSDLHQCPSEDKDADTFAAEYAIANKRYLGTLLGKINVAALKSLASAARQGIPCRVPVFDENTDQASRIDIVSGQCGGQNCHLDINFDDGVTWIARIRLQDPLLPPADIQNYIFLSEVATLQFLAQTDVPAPRVHYHQPEDPSNPVGTSYILMDKISGEPLDWNSANGEQRTKVMEQLADIFLELEKHPFQMTGSISLSDSLVNENLVEIGGFAQEPWFETLDGPLGPFATLEYAYTAVLHRHLEAIHDGEIPDLPVDNYLSFKWRLANLRALMASSASTNGPFYLKHYDDKGDHILVDNDYNITAIIDWEFASSEAKEVAFNSPCMMWPVADFYDGKNNLSEEEHEFAKIFEKRGRQDLSRLVLKGRQWQRYLFFLGGGVPDDKAEFEALFQGLRETFAHDPKSVSRYQDWKQEAIGLFSQDDLRLQALLREEGAKKGKKESSNL
ncbi:hypothetical protein F4805DRAFT_442879 [Annulohypoxylon moriforme]|nr:hypothetical protein F4805DRAFT_442879 [Annulohypoxylon moriforme]